MRVVAVFACIGLVLCSDPVYEETNEYQNTESYDGHSKQLYHGMYPGNLISLCCYVMYQKPYT